MKVEVDLKQVLVDKLSQTIFSWVMPGRHMRIE
jgi:hypothetical protein